MTLLPALPRKYHTASIWLLYAAGLVPAAWGFWLGATGRLPGNPVKEFEHLLGLWALRFLVATLAITPFLALFVWRRIPAGNERFYALLSCTRPPGPRFHLLKYGRTGRHASSMATSAM